MQETSSLLYCLLWCREGGGESCVKDTGASFQSKQLKEMQTASPHPLGAVGHSSAFC